MATGEYTDLVKAGVVDPKKVTRTALQNAGSIAGLLLTTEALITEIPEKESPAAGGGHHGPDMGWHGRLLISRIAKPKLHEADIMSASFCLVHP